MFKNLWSSLCHWWQAQQEEEQKKIAEANARNAEATARSIVQRQLVSVLSKLPAWYNLSFDSCNYISYDGGVFTFRVAKSAIDQNISRTVCKEIAEECNGLFRQLTFEAVEAMDNAYYESCDRLQTALLNAETCNFDQVYADTLSTYRSTFGRRSPHLFLLRVITAEVVSSYVYFTVKIVDDSAFHRYSPNAFRVS